MLNFEWGLRVLDKSSTLNYWLSLFTITLVITIDLIQH